MLPLHQGTNHLPLNPKVEEVLRNAPIDWGYYSDPTGSPILKEAIASHLNIDLTRYSIILTNGSIEAIYAIIDVLSKEQRHFIDTVPGWPWARHFAESRGLYIIPTKKINPSDIKHRSIVYLVNGQNPVGYTYSDEELYALEGEATSKNSVILHDIAYIDFFEKDYPLLLNNHNYITFSFSKGPGLASLRIGGLITCKINSKKFDYFNPARLGINRLSEEAALMSLYTQKEWRQKNIDTISKNKQIIKRELKNLSGVHFNHADPVQRVLITLDDWINSTEFTHRLLEEGIAVMDVSTRMFVSGIRNKELNGIVLTTAIPDNWLEEFIKKFKKIYLTFERGI